MKQGGVLSSKTRRAVCDEALGASDDYVASVVYHSTAQEGKRWVDMGARIKGRITDEQYRNLNEFLGLEDNDVIFIGLKPASFTVRY